MTAAESGLMAPKRSGQVARIEPEGVELLEAYPQMAQRFKDARWFEFLTTFQGYAGFHGIRSEFRWSRGRNRQDVDVSHIENYS